MPIQGPKAQDYAARLLSMGYLNDINGGEGMQSQGEGKLWAVPYVISDNRDVKAHREEICTRVRSYFEQHFLIAKRPSTACIFAKDDCMKSQLGRDTAERGCFMPTKGMALGIFPQYVRDIIAPVDERTHKCVFPYAGMILLHGSTCKTDIGLTLTLAHELQHFLQYTNEKSLWTMNNLLIGLHNEAFKVLWNFPIEIDARTTAKKVAECLLARNWSENTFRRESWLTSPITMSRIGSMFKALTHL